MAITDNENTNAGHANSIAIRREVHPITGSKRTLRRTPQREPQEYSSNPNRYIPYTWQGPRIPLIFLPYSNSWGFLFGVPICPIRILLQARQGAHGFLRGLRHVFTNSCFIRIWGVQLALNRLTLRLKPEALNLKTALKPGLKPTVRRGSTCPSSGVFRC